MGLAVNWHDLQGKQCAISIYFYFFFSHALRMDIFRCFIGLSSYSCVIIAFWLSFFCRVENTNKTKRRFKQFIPPPFLLGRALQPHGGPRFPGLGGLGGPHGLPPHLLHQDLSVIGLHLPPGLSREEYLDRIKMSQVLSWFFVLFVFFFFFFCSFSFCLIFSHL